MEATISAGHGPVSVATDDDGLSIGVSGRDLRWSWSEVTGAGFGLHPGAGRAAPDVPDEIAAGLPGFRSMRRLGMDLAATHEALVLVWRRDRLRSFQVFLPTADAGTRSLQAELAARLGTRWLGSGNDLEGLRRQLGVGHGRSYTVVDTAVALVLGGILILPALLGFGLIREAIEEQDLEAIGSIEPASWLAMVAWLAIVGWLLARFGRLFRH